MAVGWAIKHSKTNRKNQVMKSNNEIRNTDMPLIALVGRALDVLRQYREQGIQPNIIAKHTCSRCNERVFAPTVPLTTYDADKTHVTCTNCGFVEPFTKGGFSVTFASTDANALAAFIAALEKTDCAPTSVKMFTADNAPKGVDVNGGVK